MLYVGQLLYPQSTFGDAGSQRRLVAQDFGDSAQEEQINIFHTPAEQTVINKSVQIYSKSFNHNIDNARYSSEIKIRINEDFANNRNKSLAN